MWLEDEWETEGATQQLVRNERGLLMMVVKLQEKEERINERSGKGGRVVMIG